MVATDFLHDPQVRKWLDGIEPAWTLLTFDSLRALRQEPSAGVRSDRGGNGPVRFEESMDRGCPQRRISTLGISRQQPNSTPRSGGSAQLATPNCRELGGFGRSHSLSFDHRLRPDTLRTAIATAFFCPTNTTSRLPRVTPV